MYAINPAVELKKVDLIVTFSLDAFSRTNIAANVQDHDNFPPLIVSLIA